MEEEEERGLIKDLTRHGRLAVAWDRHGFPVPRWILTRYDGLDRGWALIRIRAAEISAKTQCMLKTSHEIWSLHKFSDPDTRLP
jgi:hypothetical protein